MITGNHGEGPEQRRPHHGPGVNWEDQQIDEVQYDGTACIRKTIWGKRAKLEKIKELYLNVYNRQQKKHLVKIEKFALEPGQDYCEVIMKKQELNLEQYLLREWERVLQNPTTLGLGIFMQVLYAVLDYGRPLLTLRARDFLVSSQPQGVRVLLGFKYRDRSRLQCEQYQEYLAPQVKFTLYGNSEDYANIVWPLGVILFQVFCGRNGSPGQTTLSKPFSYREAKRRGVSSVAAFQEYVQDQYPIMSETTPERVRGILKRIFLDSRLIQKRVNLEYIMACLMKQMIAAQNLGQYSELVQQQMKQFTQYLEKAAQLQKDAIKSYSQVTELQELYDYLYTRLGDRLDNLMQVTQTLQLLYYAIGLFRKKYQQLSNFVVGEDRLAQLIFGREGTRKHNRLEAYFSRIRCRLAMVMNRQQIQDQRADYLVTHWSILYKILRRAEYNEKETDQLLTVLKRHMPLRDNSGRQTIVGQN